MILWMILKLEIALILTQDASLITENIDVSETALVAPVSHCFYECSQSTVTLQRRHYSFNFSLSALQ